MFAKPTLWALCLCMSAVLFTGPAMADSWKHKHGHGGHHYKHHHGDYYGGHGYKWYPQYAGGPPPWAPAHGYRRKHSHGHGYSAGYLPPFDIGLGRCNREVLGSLLGAAAGGLAGSQIGDGRGQLAAVAGGTILGFLVGGSIGRHMDYVDQNCIGQALEHAQDGQEIIWRNPEADARYQVVPTQTIQNSDGRYCREYTAEAVINGRVQQTYGRACRQPDGSWQLTS